MRIQIENDETLEITVGNRVWDFTANSENDVLLQAQSNGRYCHAIISIIPYGLTERITGARLKAVEV